MEWILASASPRRREILKQYVADFQIVPSQVWERGDDFVSAQSMVMSFAFQKAWDVAQRVSEDGLVIGADTVVYLDEVLMKPRSEEEATEMLLKLSGTTHFVYTGIALIHRKSFIKLADYEATKVTFRPLSEAQIASYVKSKEPLDKAGGYGIQGRGALWVEKIEGNCDNVVGLPMGLLAQLLNRHFNISLWDMY